MNWTTPRTARKIHHCASCDDLIGLGERHLEHVAAPLHDIHDNEHWWRSRECAECATRYGRGALVGDE